MSSACSSLSSWNTPQISVTNLAVFPRIWACFLWSCGLLVLGLVSIERCLFFGLVFCRFLLRMTFFQILWQFGCFNLLQNAIWACFMNICSFGLVFRICLPAFVYNLPAVFCFVKFSYQTHFGFVFRLNVLFWVCFTNLLACFCKLTWHHCYGSWRLWLLVLNSDILAGKAARQQGRRNVGGVGGKKQSWGQWRLTKNKKIVANYQARN